MKQLFIILFSLGLALGASAQRHGRIGGGVRYGRPHVAIIGTYAPFSPYYGYGYGFSPFYAYPPMYHSYRPTKLDLQIEDIRNDYQDRIWSVKHDKDLPRKERKAKVHELKHEREEAIIDAKRNYYKMDNRF